jgi:hypothetical protein
MIDDINADFDVGDEDEFGGGLEGSPLTIQEEIELEEAFQGTDEFLTGFRAALDNAGAASVAAATTDTLLFQTPLRSEAGQAITAAGDLVDELEGTAQALALNEIGDAILASGVDDFLEPFKATDSTLCEEIKSARIANDESLLSFGSKGLYVPLSSANNWVVTNGKPVGVSRFNVDWVQPEAFYYFTPNQQTPLEINAPGKSAKIHHLVAIIEERNNSLDKAFAEHCQVKIPHPPTQPPTATPPVGFPPGFVPPADQIQHPPTPPTPGGGVVWCGVEYTAKDIEDTYGPGWEWYPAQPAFGNPRLPTHRDTFHPDDPGPRTDDEWARQWWSELDSWEPGELDPYYAENYLSFFRLPWGIPPGWEIIDDYKGPLKDNEAWVINYFQIDIGGTAGVPPFNNRIASDHVGVDRVRIACIPDTEEKPTHPPGKPVVATPKQPTKEKEACVGEKIEICGWDDLIGLWGGGTTGVAGKCKLWESCDSGIIYATSGGQEPRNEEDKAVEASEIGIADLQRFIASCSEEAKGDAVADKKNEKPIELGKMGQSTGCAVLPKAAGWNDESLINPIIDLIAGLVPKAVGIPGSGPLWLEVAKAALEWVNLEDALPWKANLNDLFKRLVTSEECESPEFLKFKSAEILVGFLNTWLGGGFQDALIAISQQSRYLCPVSVPSAEDATTAYLADVINKDTLDCWSRANGMMTEGWDRVVEANRSKLGVNELVQLFRRKEISGVEFNQRVRQLGFLRQNEAEEFKTLGQVIPPISDLVRFMVRDTADEKIYKPFRMDEGFTEKFKDQVESWANDQGVDKEYMRHVWRAHWTIPSPSQLFSMVHRNSRLDPSDKAYVNIDTVKAALKQQDIMPFWIDPLLNISYRPLNRVDTRRAFDVGVLNKAEVKEAYLNQGYNDENATILANFAERIRSTRYLKHASIREYAAGGINTAGLSKWAIEDGANESDIAPMVDRAQDIMRADARLECVKSYEKRFQHGEFDSAVLTEKLGAEQLDALQVEQLVKGAECKRNASGKQASISQLCKWFTEGVLPEHEFYARLLELNWAEEDAIRLIRDCQIQREISLSKEAAKRLREAMKRTKANERELTRSAAERARAKKRALTASKAATARRLRISRLMDKAAGVYAKKAELDPVEGLEVLTGIATRLKAGTLFTLEEIGQALVFLTKESDTIEIEPLYVELVATLNQAIIPEPVGN